MKALGFQVRASLKFTFGINLWVNECKEFGIENAEI